MTDPVDPTKKPNFVKKCFNFYLDKTQTIRYGGYKTKLGL